MHNRCRKNLASSFLKCVVFESWKCISVSANSVLHAQPTPKSHPHLLKPGEVTPNIKSDVYRRRRMRLLNLIRESVRDDSIPHLVLIPAASVVYMSENIPYPFRQRTDFLYMCGFKEANSVLLLSTIASDESVLFVPKPTTVLERWEGVKMDLRDTSEFLGVDRALYMDDLESHLHSIAKMSKKFIFWYDFSGPSSIQKSVQNFIEACSGYVTVESPRVPLHRCRIIKSPEEAELMQKSCRIGAESLKEVIKFSKPNVLESHLQAKMKYECCLRGGDYLAFPPVVAGGSRANTIHYIDNNQIVHNNEMVLMDAGCEYGGYCSDLARTWPVSGKFTDSQRELYDLILSIQEHLIGLCAERPSLDHLFRVMCDRLGADLQSLGIIHPNLDKENIAKVAYNFCPHHVSHYLGMDVHDTDVISRGIKLIPGMVITVEPGIYISKDDSSVPEKYRGLCIRIEDDILITEKGVQVLTSACPKNADELERLVISQE